MANADPVGPTRADLHAPTTMGVIGVSFAVALLAGGLCANALFLGPALILEAVSQSSQSRTRYIKVVNERTVRLAEEEARATDPAVRADLKESRETAETEARALTEERAADRTRIVRDLPLRSPTYLTHFVADLATGFVLNLLLLIASTGLLFRGGWARTLSLVVAVAKVLRLFVLAVSMSLIVAPFCSKIVADLETQMPVEGVESIASQVRLTLTASSWVVAILGSIYPVALIYVLLRPSVRAAFERRGNP